MTHPINEIDLKQESLSAAKESDKSGRLNASTQALVSVKHQDAFTDIRSNHRYIQPDQFLSDVNNRYL